MVYTVSIMTMNMRELSAYICCKLAPAKISSRPGLHVLLFESPGPFQDWSFRGLQWTSLHVSRVKKASGEPPPTTPLHPIASPSELCSLLHTKNISVSLMLELQLKEAQQQNSLKNTHRGKKKFLNTLASVSSKQGSFQALGSDIRPLYQGE